MTTSRDQTDLDPPDDDLRALFRRTAPEAPPTDLDALLARAGTSDFRSPKPMRSRRLLMTIRIAAGMAAAAGIAALVSLLAPRESSAAFGLAEVQREVKATRTVTFTTDLIFDGKPRASTRTSIQSPGRYRFEHADGYTVIDRQARKSMTVNSRQKTAQLSDFAPDPSQRDVHSLLMEAPEKPAETLPARTIAGKRALGFVATWHGREVAIWVDPDTRLPVRVEQTRKELGHTVESVTRDIAFDRPLDDSLFRMVPPADHHDPVFTPILITGPELLPVPDDPALAAPAVMPRAGIGPARFGMPREEVVRRLGKPDHEFTQGKTAYVSYRSRGFELGIDPEHGLSRVSCFGPRDKPVDPARGFRGKTDKGIGLGAGRAEVVAAYGEPDREAGAATDHATLDYEGRGLSFALFRGKVVRITLDAPR